LTTAITVLAQKVLACLHYFFCTKQCGRSLSYGMLASSETGRHQELSAMAVVKMAVVQSGRQEQANKFRSRTIQRDEQAVVNKTNRRSSIRPT
jgi:hypothetical protein